MAQAVIRIGRSPGERRTAVLLGGRLCEAWVERPARPDGVGDVVAARIAAIAPAMAGCFVTMPDGATGFLPDSEARGTALHEGLLVVARITRAAQGGKGPRLSLRRAPDVEARAPGLLARGPDAAQRAIAAHPRAPIVADDRTEAARLGARYDPQAFDDALEAAFDALAEPRIAIDGGGTLWVQPTQALTALDADAGAHAGARDRNAQRRFNAVLVAEAARQIRLRNLAGPILLDMAGLPVKERSALEAPLRAALAADPLCECLGLGPLGLFEMRRARIHPTLAETLGDPVTPALRLLREAAREAAAAPQRRLALRAPARTLEALRAMPEAMAEFAAVATHPIILQDGPPEIADA